LVLIARDLLHFFPQFLLISLSIYLFYSHLTGFLQNGQLTSWRWYKGKSKSTGKLRKLTTVTW
jgi:hypothetical protein